MTPELLPTFGLGTPDAPHNHCRNPDRSRGVWCYVDSPGSGREFCDVPPCPAEIQLTSAPLLGGGAAALSPGADANGAAGPAGTATAEVAPAGGGDDGLSEVRAPQLHCRQRLRVRRCVP